MDNYTIFDYWKDKEIGGEPVIRDNGEPICWACERPVMVETEGNLIKSDIECIWNKTRGKLEQCHIIPKALGGKNTPDNLFLLCQDCHAESPDTIYPEIFFKWVISRRKRCSYGIDTVILERDIKDICIDYGINIDDFALYVCKNGDIKSIIGRANTHGAKLSRSTILGLLARDYLCA